MWPLYTFLILLLAFPAGAQGRKPEKKPAKSESHPVQNLKEGANQALNDVDRGVHKAIPAVKEGAEKALDAVDQGVHKVIEPKKN
jgi:hypothetical protein